MAHDPPDQPDRALGGRIWRVDSESTAFSACPLNGYKFDHSCKILEAFALEFT
jgi:hypothetical protein